MNASLASGVSVNCDSIKFCFSKGLGAPVGSILIREKSLIDRQRRLRKCVGGGMRQVDILYQLISLYIVSSCTLKRSKI